MIRFAVFTDLHYDHIPDGDRRIKEFLETVRLKNPDFILSLGDLCYSAYRCIIQSAIMIRIGIRLKK